MDTYSQGLIDIGKLALQFAKVNRVTFHEDGVRPESDTDHTVMLSLCACALAHALYKDVLDIGKVAQFALVHDLVEVYAGDTDSINLSHEAKEEKEKKEKESLTRITNQFANVYPWIHTMIIEYESLVSQEARFVKVLDKAMTKITNILDHGAAIKRHGASRDELTSHYKNQRVAIMQYAAPFPELVSIFDILTTTMIDKLYGEKSTDVL
jgi:putative hydrolase of HD superfamily